MHNWCIASRHKHVYEVALVATHTLLWTPTHIEHGDELFTVLGLNHPWLGCGQRRDRSRGGSGSRGQLRKRVIGAEVGEGGLLPRLTHSNQPQCSEEALESDRRNDVGAEQSTSCLAQCSCFPSRDESLER